MRNARRVDIEYNGHDRNSPLDGPIARRLKEYGRVKAFVVGPRAEMSSDLHSLINCISERAAEVKWRGTLATDVITAKGVIKTMITNSLGILGARANAECLEDRLGIMVGEGRQRSVGAEARMRPTGRHTKSTAGTTAQATAATQVAGPKEAVRTGMKPLTTCPSFVVRSSIRARVRITPPTYATGAMSCCRLMAPPYMRLGSRKRVLVISSTFA